MTTQDFNEWLQKVLNQSKEELDKYYVPYTQRTPQYQNLYAKYRDQIKATRDVERKLKRKEKEAESWKKKYYKLMYKYKTELQEEDLPKHYNPYLESNPNIPTKEQVHSERVSWLEDNHNFVHQIIGIDSDTSYIVEYSYSETHGVPKFTSTTTYSGKYLVSDFEEARDLVYKIVKNLYEVLKNDTPDTKRSGS